MSLVTIQLFCIVEKKWSSDNICYKTGTENVCHITKRDTVCHDAETANICQITDSDNDCHYADSLFVMLSAVKQTLLTDMLLP